MSNKSFSLAPDKTAASPELASHQLLRSVPLQTVSPPAGSRLILESNPHSLGADRFRHLRNALKQQRGLRKLKSVAVVSPLPQDGKSTATMNLASALAEGGESVLCIEADVYNPTIARSISYEAPVGLAECVTDDVDPLSAIVRFDPLRWYFLSAGQKLSSPSKISSNGIGNVLRKLEAYFNWIILDTPPLVPIRNTVSLIDETDGALLVIRAGRTPQNLVDESLELIGRKQTLGIVLNAADELNRTYDGYYGRYYRRE